MDSTRTWIECTETIEHLKKLSQGLATNQTRILQQRNEESSVRNSEERDGANDETTTIKIPRLSIKQEKKK